MRLIETSEELQKLCNELQNKEFVTLDTEFVREKTYYPRLCLIQIAFKEDAAIIDPLAKGINLEPFFDILQNEKILKIFHSGRQDIEIFYNLTGKTPKPVFDTQIAASVCGFGRSISYGNLVEAVTKIELDKTTRLTDWSLRPLDEKQLEYALRDVTFLIPCYEYLKDYMEKNHRTDWIESETKELLDEKLYENDPETAWLKIKHSVHSGRFLTALKELAAWRERRAMKFNIPKRSIIKDETLVAIASSMPKTMEDFKQVRTMRSDISGGKLATEILEVLEKARHLSVSSDLRKINEKRHVKIPSGALALTEVLKLLLKIKCEQEGVVETIVATEDDIKDLACGNDKDNPLLMGWRYELFGKDALAFRKGKASLSYDTIQKRILVQKKEK